MDPLTINLLLTLFGKATEIAVGLRNQLRDAGVTDERLDAIDADYTARIARREAEAQG